MEKAKRRPFEVDPEFVEKYKITVRDDGSTGERFIAYSEVLDLEDCGMGENTALLNLQSRINAHLHGGGGWIHLD